MTLSAAQFPDPTQQDVHDPHHYLPNPHKGKLFTEQQWPHGYGPERSRRIDEALKDVRFGVGGRNVDAPHNPGFPLDPDVRGQHHEHVGNVIKAIKRSTVPPEHVADIGRKARARLGDWAEPNINLVQDFDVAGNYNLATDAIRIGQHEAALGANNWPEYRDQPNVLQHIVTHEIGHHVAATRLGDEYAQYQAKGVGEVEGHADAYAALHSPQDLKRATRGYTERMLAHRAVITGQGAASQAGQYLNTMRRYNVPTGERFSEENKKLADLMERNSKLNAKAYYQYRLFD